MASYNRVVLIGNLTRDPEFKQLVSGQAVCRLGLATNRQFKNKSSAGVVQEVCFIDVDVWGAQAESCRQYLQKGRPILVEGRLKFDSWQDQAGATRSRHSIVADRVLFLGSQAHETVSDVATASEAFDSSSDSVGSFTLNQNNKVERELMEQLAKAEKKVKASKVAQNGDTTQKKREDFASIGEVDFKDQPPFEDELPF